MAINYSVAKMLNPQDREPETGPAAGGLSCRYPIVRRIRFAPDCPLVR